MNLLESALPPLNALITNQVITIISFENKIVDGFPESVKSELNTIAHIQPLTGIGNTSIGNTSIGNTSILNSEIACKFYILRDLAQALNFVYNVDCEIIWNDKVFSIFNKEDWSSNGWIKVVGTLRGKENV